MSHDDIMYYNYIIYDPHKFPLIITIEKYECFFLTLTAERRTEPLTNKGLLACSSSACITPSVVLLTTPAAAAPTTC